MLPLSVYRPRSAAYVTRVTNKWRLQKNNMPTRYVRRTRRHAAWWWV